MAIVNGYTTLATLKSRISISDETDDTELERIVTAVSRAIDDYCGRRFYAAAETRYYTAQHSDRLMVDDLLSITTLSTDDDGDRNYENNWAETDYYLYPDNAALDGQPYWRIDVDGDNGDYTFPVGVRRGVKVVGSFGFCATGSHPAPVEEACLIQSSRLFRRKDAPFGVAGSGEFGQTMIIARLDPDVKMLLGPYRRVVVG